MLEDFFLEDSIRILKTNKFTILYFHLNGCASLREISVISKELQQLDSKQLNKRRDFLTFVQFAFFGFVQRSDQGRERRKQGQVG